MGKTLIGSLARSAGTFLNRTPVSFAPPGSGRRGSGFATGLLRPAGQEAQLRAVGTNSTLFAIVDRLITSYSQVEWHLYRKAPSGRAEDRVEVTSHAALDLWAKPNKFMTGPTFRAAAQQHEELTGEQWWVISRHPNATLPLELWPVRPDRMEPVPDAEDFIVGYVYRSPSGELVPLGIDDVIFQPRPNPIDPYRGMGVVQTILIDLDATRASAEWNRAFFANSAEPGGVIEVDRPLSDPEFDEFNDRWREQHKGVANAHRVGMLEAGMRWIDRKYTMRDMQFTQLRDVGREVIREAFGMPKPMLGSVDDVNRANAEAAAFVFAEWLIKPRLRRIKEVLNTRLLPMYGPMAKGLEFDFDDPTPENREADSNELTARTAAAAALVHEGFDPAGTLSAVGLPEIPYAGVPARPKAPTSAASWDEATAGLIGGDNDGGGIEAAMRWEAVAVIDDDTCQPCADNDGTTYRSRAAAYKDYPGGSGYVKCVGAEHGNKCRCKVVKRRKTGDDE